MTRIAPSDLDAEAAVLSACMLSETALAEVRAILGPEAFYADANRRVFDAIVALDDERAAVDSTIVAGRLRDTGRLQQIGGTAYISQLIDATPAVINVEEHARIVAEKARLRAVIATCQRLAAEGYADVGDVGQWCNDAVAELARVTDERVTDDTLMLAKEASAETWAELEARAQGPGFAGVQTGFPGLDRRTGGLRRGVQYCVAGSPGMGKTAFALGVALNVAASGLGVVFVSTEMPRPQLVARAIAQRAGLDSNDLERGRMNKQAWSDAAAAAQWFAGLPIAIDDRPAQTASGIRAAVRRGLARLRYVHGAAMELGLVAVDYIQILNGERQRGDSREQEVSGLSKKLMWLAKELDVPVMTLSQLNRPPGNKTRTARDYQLSDLRESGAIEQDNFGVLFVHRDDQFERDETKHNGKAEIVLAKLRQGGACGIVDMMFKGPSMRFYERASEYDEYGDDIVGREEARHP